VTIAVALLVLAVLAAALWGISGAAIGLTAAPHLTPAGQASAVAPRPVALAELLGARTAPDYSAMLCAISRRWSASLAVLELPTHMLEHGELDKLQRTVARHGRPIHVIRRSVVRRDGTEGSSADQSGKFSARCIA